MKQGELISQLFRAEFSKMVAVIGRLSGLQHIDMAEDIVSDTFLAAADKWAIEGMPANPQGWLYTVARNKALDQLRRHKIFSGKIMPQLAQGDTFYNEEDIFTDSSIKDSQLSMLFAVCHPAIAGEAQIALALRILCGLTADEIAEAFFTNKETIAKRIYRAREKLKSAGLTLEIPADKSLSQRMEGVLHTIYLLFNEGYHATTGSSILRKDLCLEAIRLGLLLVNTPVTSLPEANALVALMCFHSSRFVARDGGQAILYEQQDERLWDPELIKLGNYYLNVSASGTVVSTYHLEAGIARWHCNKEDTPEKWDGILQLYNKLLQINYSPRAALNRTYAFYKVFGAEAALGEALKLKLEADHFYHVLLAELYGGSDKAMAIFHLQKAHSLARSDADKQTIARKLQSL